MDNTYWAPRYVPYLSSALTHFIQSIPHNSSAEVNIKMATLRKSYFKKCIWSQQLGGGGAGIVCFIAWAHVNLMGGMTSPRPYRGDVRTWTWVLSSFLHDPKPPWCTLGLLRVWAHRLVERYFESYSSGVDKLSNMAPLHFKVTWLLSTCFISGNKEGFHL